jgi:hypothetical protein
MKSERKCYIRALFFISTVYLFISPIWSFTASFDIDADNKTDIAVWRPSSGIWYILQSSTPENYTSTQWGLPTDIAVPGDYDGDGKTDIAVCRPGDYIWYIIPSSAPNTYTISYWGMPGDLPVSHKTEVVAPPTLVSLAVSPSSHTMAVGEFKWFTALGTFSDGSQKDVTKTVEWS